MHSVLSCPVKQRHIYSMCQTVLYHTCVSCGYQSRSCCGCRASQSHNVSAVPPLSHWSGGLGRIHVFWYGDPYQRVHRPLWSCTLALGTPKLIYYPDMYDYFFRPLPVKTCFSPQQAMVLCYFLENNLDKYNLTDKNVIELGAGTGLVSIVSSLLGTENKPIQRWASVVSYTLNLSFFSLSVAFCISFPLTLDFTISLQALRWPPLTYRMYWETSGTMLCATPRTDASTSLW